MTLTIDFVALEFESANVPATVKVNLYDSVNVSDAALLASTSPVTMPSGFVNNGLAVAGVEYFYFSTPITLTPGDTYFLEPTLVSGGAQWAFVTIIGDTYPNGELNVNGHPFVNPTDMWFQEGVEAVPEPATFPLIAFVCISVYIFRHPLKLPKPPVLACAGALFNLPVLSINAAQDSVAPTNFVTMAFFIQASELLPTIYSSRLALSAVAILHGIGQHQQVRSQDQLIPIIVRLFQHGCIRIKTQNN